MDSKEIRRGVRSAIQPFEIEVATIHNVESARFGNELVENVDVVNSCRRNAKKSGNPPPQVQQRVQFQGVLRRLEVCPRNSAMHRSMVVESRA